MRLQTIGGSTTVGAVSARVAAASGGHARCRARIRPVAGLTPNVRANLSTSTTGSRGPWGQRETQKPLGSVLGLRRLQFPLTLRRVHFVARRSIQ